MYGVMKKSMARAKARAGARKPMAAPARPMAGRKTMGGMLGRAMMKAKARAR